MEVPTPPRNFFCPKCRRRSSAQGGTLCPRCLDDRELLNEDVTTCPPFLDGEDFERFMRKLAVHAHVRRPSAARAVTLDQMEMSLTDAVVDALPLYYISTLEYTRAKQKSTGSKGSYTLKAKIPQNVLYRTVEKLGLWTKQEPEPEDGFTEA